MHGDQQCGNAQATGSGTAARQVKQVAWQHFDVKTYLALINVAIT
jgi:hypothetical protein